MQRKIKLSISIKCFLILFFGISLISSDNFFAKDRKENHFNDLNKKVFNSIIKKAKKQNWHNLHIQDIIINVAMNFIDFPYKSGTLDIPGPEKCRVDFSGLDCVTFMENSLCLARIIKKQKYNYNDLIDEITYTRYRNGKLTDYSSRLHYTSEWIFDNEKKSVIENITKLAGGVEHLFNTNFMSSNPKYYEALKNDESIVKKIKLIENEITKMPNYIIPLNLIEENYKYFKSGDIVAIATSINGLDYSHVGLIFIDDQKNVRFFHASSKHKKVMVDTTLADYVKSVKSNIGITVLGPL